MEASVQTRETTPAIQALSEVVASPVVRSRWQAKRSGSAAPGGDGHVAIVGSGDSVTSSVALLCGASSVASRCSVVIDTRQPKPADHESLGLRVTGPFAHISHKELHEAADEFVLAFGPEDSHHAVTAAWRLISDDVSFRVMPQTMGCVYHLLAGLGWAEVPVVPVHRGLWQALGRAWKSGLDVVVAALTLAVLLPLLAVVALLVHLESPGPAIFTQDRVGKNGRVFRIFKFRTMVTGAHEDEARVRAECSADARFVKIACDPRVTRLGRVLRKTSMDELPQLWNVLRGDMSLVGPRPSQPSEVELYEPDQFTRLLVKPGVTGMWQVSGRSELCFEDAVKLDSAYVRDWSPLLDLKIMAKTVAVVLQCRGAC